MKMRIAKAWTIRLAIVVSVACFNWYVTTTSHAQVAGAPRAVVEAVQGGATVITGTDEEPERLGTGSTVNAWNMVNTNGSSKLFIRWGSGLLNSLGEFSSMFLASTDTPSGPMDAIQVTEGVLRVTKQRGGSSPAPYVVTTPSASVEPVNYDEPLDFVVEVYSPKTSAVTVISGQVRVRNTTLSQPVETLVDPCQTVYVEEGRSDLDVVVSAPADLDRIVAHTTIPNTIAAGFQCQVSSPPPSVVQPPAVVPQYVQYEYEDWESYDVYPYNEITILPPEPGIGCVVILPGIGRWIIPIEVFAGWRFDPVVIGVYCRHVILDHMMYRDQYYLADARLRQRQLRHLIYLAQLSGNRNMLLGAQRQLADVNVQSRWAAMRLNRLEQKVAGLDQEQRKFANKLPQGKNLFQGVSNSFNSPKNLAVAQNFRDRVKTELSVQGQLAGLAGRELVDVRSKIAREKNPQARLALTDEFHKLSKDVARGKLPIPANQAQVKQVLERFKAEQDPHKLQTIQKELTQLTKVDAPGTSELLNQKNLTTLKQDLAKYPNPQVRSNLEAQVGQLQHSVEATKAAELNREKIDTITAQAAQEPNVQKRNELLGQIKELAKPAAVGVAGAAGAVGALNLLQKRQAVESQLSLEQDKQKRADLEKVLEDQRKHQAESLRQQLDRGKQTETLQRQQEELKKQTDRKFPEHEGLKQTDQVRQQELDRQKLLQQQEFQKHQAEQKRNQEELLKQTDQKRHLEQLEKQKQQQLGEQKLLQQQEEQRRRQIEVDRLKKLEQPKLDQTEQKRFQEQTDKARQKQLEQTLQLRKQQELESVQRKHQEQELQLRKQQEQGLQLRRQQEQSQQMRHQPQQQEQQKLLQQQQQQQQMLQQQRQQQLFQQQQLQQQHQQQLLQQQRQQQMRQQQEEELKRKTPPPPPGPPIR
jgi:hypothetical protein